MLSSFWAPELYYHNDKVYAYYTVRDTNGISCIGVATADRPESGFTDHGVIIRTGKEAIDAFIYNDSGQLYVTWKAYGLDKRPIELLSSKLSADGLRLTGDTVSIMKDSVRKGLEGQSMIKRNEYYYLFYSAGSCCGVPCDYNLRVSRSKYVTGPFEDFTGNPVLKETAQWMCTGHGTPVQQADGRWFFLFHGYEKESNVFTGRQGLISEISWDDKTGWPLFKQPRSADMSLKNEWTDNFDSKDLLLQWSWDFRNSDIRAKNDKGVLELSGNVKERNQSGTVLCVRAISPVYEISTEVANVNASLKGLVLYGDDNSNAGIGVKENEIIIWSNNNNKKEILKTIKLTSAKSLRLKISVTYGRILRFFYSTDGRKWSQVPAGLNGIDGLDVSYTKQWDRAPRPGLIHQGKPSEPARFSWCRISNN
ncbi:MAG: beta-xylosidase [Chitinophagaceae bacterium]|nr:MAG: beta-xylosidase [Chitinophagaceae bacterium]